MPASIDQITAILASQNVTAKLDRLDAKLAGMEPVRPIDLVIAIEAGRDALAVIGMLMTQVDWAQVD